MKMIWDDLSGSTFSPTYEITGKSQASDYFDPDFQQIHFKECEDKAVAKFIGPCSFKTASKILKKTFSLIPSSKQCIISYKKFYEDVMFSVIHTNNIWLEESCEEPDWFIK